MDLSEYGVTETEIEFLAKKEKEGNLVYQISSEFTGDADQITITPASGKTFYLVGIKLYPVVNAVVETAANGTRNRRADVELTFDSTVKDVLTWDFEQTGSSSTVSNFHMSSEGVGQLTGLAKGISMEGNGAKTIKLTSTNTSGTYRVAILGYYEDT